LYEKVHLALPLPIQDKKPSGKTLLVWGGSSSVGSTTIQLAAASGLTVIATASSKSHDYVKSMGAKEVFDYSKPTIVDEVVAALKGSEFAGAYDAISLPDTINLCSDCGQAGRW